jgi:hypothetical protein
VNVGAILGRLNPYQAQERKIVEDQSTGDIISAITTSHEKYKPEYKKIALFFKGSNPKQTGKKLFDFLKNNVRYIIEPGDKQTVKSPAAILAQGHGDCKHYSLFAGGVLQQLGVPFAYRFASYKTFDPQPGHVFVVINPGTSNEIWVDPVLTSFDYKKPYTHAKDKRMALYTVSGIGQATPAQKAALKQAKAAKKMAKGKAAKKAAKVEVKAARKAAGRTAGQVLKKGAKVVLKVNAAPMRAAFLLLVKLNFANLGVKLKRAWDKAPSKLQTFWESAGGKIDALKKAWEKGSTKKRIFGDDTIGALPAAAAAAPAAAAPLLVKIAEVLRNIGIEPEELVEIGKDAINQKAQELAKKALQPKAAKEAAQVEVADQLEADIEEATTATPAPMFKAATGTNMLPLILGGAAVLYFVMRKK